MKKKIFIIAGEVSGDVIGGEIMRAASLKADFAGIGGNDMARQGLESLFPISDLSVMGLIPVLKKLRTVLSRIRQTAEAIIKEKPDIVLTIDSPSFASRVIKKVKHLLKNSDYTPKFYHVVAPQVWAWASHRAKKYAKIFDKLFCFFDFEVPYFTKYGLETIAIGYPFYEVIKEKRKKDNWCGTKNIVMLLPGSRMAEIKKTMPIFKDFIELHSKYSFVISTTEITHDFIENEIKSWKIKPKICQYNNRYELYNQAKFAISKSGTVTAELAIIHVPTVVIYPTNFLSPILAKLLLKINFISLLNIITNKKIFPELLGWNINARKISEAVSNMDMKKIINDLKAADKLWHKNKSPFEMIAENL